MLQSASAWRDLRRFFGLTFLLSWGVGGVYFAARRYIEPLTGPFGPQNVVFLMINCAPSLAALLCSIIGGGPYGLIVLLNRLVRPFAWFWLPFGLLIIPAIALALGFAMPYVDPQWPVHWSMVAVDLPIIMIATPQILANIAPFGEELGWRGYALPLLLRETNAYVATLILGAVWIIWHVPGFFIVGVMAPSLSLFGCWSIGTLALTMVMTFLFVRANGNVLVAGIVPHFVINAAASVGVWESRPPETLSLAALAVILAIALAFNRTSAAPARARQ